MIFPMIVKAGLERTSKGQQVYVPPPTISCQRSMHPSGYIVKKTKLSDRCQKECLLRLHPRFPQISARLSFPCQKICPENFVPRDEQIPILIWGAGSSVGHFAVQILKNWGYKNVIVAASLKHEKKLKCYGAAYVFDYRSTGVVDCILELLTSSKSPEAIRVFDCVDSKFGSLLPISKIATRAGSKVAVVLPVVINSSSDANGLQLSAHVSTGADWAKVVEIHSIVSYGYEANAFLRGNLFLEILPTLLAQGAIEPASCSRGHAARASLYGPRHHEDRYR